MTDTPEPTTPPEEPPALTPAQLRAQKRKETRMLKSAALRRLKSDEAAAGGARALERQKRREENKRKHREEQALKRRDADSAENTELWNAVALLQAQGKDILAACADVFGQEQAEDAAASLQADGRYTRLLARYKAFNNRTDDQVRHDLESFYYAMIHDPEADPKARLTAAKQLSQLRNLETQRVEVKSDAVIDFFTAQLAIANNEPPPWQRGAVDV